MPSMGPIMKKVLRVCANVSTTWNFGDGYFDQSYQLFNSFMDYKCPTTYDNLISFLKQQYRGVMINKIKVKVFDIHFHDFNQHATLSSSVNTEKLQLTASDSNEYVKAIKADAVLHDKKKGLNKWIPFENSEWFDHPGIYHSDNMYYLRWYIPKSNYDLVLNNSDTTLFYNKCYPRLYKGRGKRYLQHTFYPRAKKCADPYAEGFISSTLSIKDFLSKVDCKANINNFGIMMNFGPFEGMAQATTLNRREQVFMTGQYVMRIYTTWSRRVIKDVTWQ